MKRYCELSEISDGKLYEINDLVKVGCDGCEGAAFCCHGMGNSVVLDPFDIYRLTENQEETWEDLFVDKIELKVVDGIILPNLKMTGKSESCVYLEENGRCSIHRYRPGFCRIFPLGRYYENHDFKYFLQIKECKNTHRMKTKINKWVDTKNFKEYKSFLIDWHYFLNEIEDMVNEDTDDKVAKIVNLHILNNFYGKRYERDFDFYSQFMQRLEEAKNLFRAMDSRNTME
ncbi:MAG: YkgJ family cysteine cluster protein [Velocimicrobium sp.]